MLKKVFIIDNDIRYSNSLKNKIDNTDLYTECKVVKEFNDIDSIEDISSYDVYFIRLDKKTIKIIDELSDEDKKVVILTNKYDEKTREQISSFGVSDYIITDNNAQGNTALNILNRLSNNADLTVLLVDDSSLILNTLVIMLETQNINYVKCKNGKEAWDYLSDLDSKKIDLIISDYEMPLMDGYELTRRVRSKYSKEELPLLILSGTEDNSMIAKFLKAGANDYIPKPFIPEEFFNRISNTLSSLEMHRKIKNF